MAFWHRKHRAPLASQRAPSTAAGRRRLGLESLELRHLLSAGGIAPGEVVTQFPPSSTATGNVVAVQGDGKIVAAGAVQDGIALARYAADGSLDSQFGHGGETVVAFSSLNDGSAIDFEVRAVSIETAGRILVVASEYKTGGGSETNVVRLNADGTLDTSFDGGVATIQGIAYGLAVQPDGKIVVAGTMIARLNADGTLDTTLAGSGEIIAPFDTADPQSSTFDDWNRVTAVAIDSSGRIVVAGEIGDSNASGTGVLPIGADGLPILTPQNGESIAVARYGAGGTLDASFGTGGVELAKFSNGDNTASSLAIQSDGKIVVGGGIAPGRATYADFMLVRFDANGSLDSSFGGSGYVTTDLGANDTITDIALQADGKIVAVGNSDMIAFPAAMTASAGPAATPALGVISTIPASGLVAVRYNIDGSLDPSFDNAQSGTAVQDLNGLALEADGQIVVVGTVLNTRGMLVAGLNQDGSLNPQFGTASVNPFSVSGDTLTIYAQPGVNTLDISYYNSYVTVTLNGTSQSFFANGLFGPINNLVYRGNGSADQVTVETGGDSFTQSSSYQGGTIVISTETVGPLSDIVIFGSITIQVTGTGTISANETVKIPATQPPSTAPPGPAYPTPLLISVAANVLPVSALQFHPGSDVSVLQNSGQVSVPLWATSITDAGQAPAPGTITFVTHTSNDTFFSELPWINSAGGTLTFTPATGAFGSVKVTVYLTDWNNNTSASYTFHINVGPRPWQNPSIATDVNGDGAVSPIDALILINEINAQGTNPLKGPAKPNSAGFDYWDVNGDNQLTPLDALAVIDALDLKVNPSASGVETGPVLFPPAVAAPTASQALMGSNSGLVAAAISQATAPMAAPTTATAIQTVESTSATVPAQPIPAQTSASQNPTSARPRIFGV